SLKRFWMGACAMAAEKQVSHQTKSALPSAAPMRSVRIVHVETPQLRLTNCPGADSVGVTEKLERCSRCVQHRACSVMGAERLRSRNHLTPMSSRLAAT